jgi:hypothetical protein
MCLQQQQQLVAGGRACLRATHHIKGCSSRVAASGDISKGLMQRSLITRMLQDTKTQAQQQ